MTTDQATKAEQVAGRGSGRDAGQVSGPVAGSADGQATGQIGEPVTGQATGQIGGPVTGQIGGPVTGQAGGHPTGPGPFARPVAPPAVPARSRRRRGAGGRWLVWCVRAVVWTILLLIGYRGVVAIVTGSPSPAVGGTGPHAHAPGTGKAGAGQSRTGPGRSGAASTGRASTGHTGTGQAGTGLTGTGLTGTGQTGTGQAGTGLINGLVDGFPVTLAQAYALDFGQAYLNFSPSSAGQRAAALAQFLPPGTNPQLGYNGKGTQTLQSEQVAATHVMSAHVAVVTLLAEVNGKLIELGVPIYASGGAMVVSGKPALLPPPPKATVPAARAQPGDRVADAALARRLPAFFRAFASSAVVRASSLISGPGDIAGLNGVVTFDGIASVSVPATSAPATGTTRHITVTVIWRTPGQTKVRTSTVANIPATIATTYAMTVVQRGGNWYVESIGASAATAG